MNMRVSDVHQENYITVFWGFNVHENKVKCWGCRRNCSCSRADVVVAVAQITGLIPDMGAVAVSVDARWFNLEFKE